MLEVTAFCDPDHKLSDAICAERSAELRGQLPSTSWSLSAVMGNITHGRNSKDRQRKAVEFLSNKIGIAVMMVNEISERECRAVPGRASIGRLGCARDNQPYVVPVYLAYEPDYIYVF